VTLSLLVGPANAGKVEALLDRYLAAFPREPVLIVPNRSDVDRVERDLLSRAGCLLGGTIGTFDDVFRRIAHPERPVATDVQRSLVLRRAAGPGRSTGFLDALGEALRELEAGLVSAEEVGGELRALYAAYRAELDTLALTDRELVRGRAVERLRGDLDAWRGEPVFAYGFEDLTAAEWGLLEALAGRAEVTVSLPYEPGRPAFASLQRTAEALSRLARGAIEELPPRYAEVAQPAIAHVERGLFSDVQLEAPAIEGSVRFFEGAGTRGALELVGEEVAALVRAGTQPERIGLLCPSVERWRAPLETAFGTLGIAYAVEGPVRLPLTALGQALLSILRFAWLGGSRGDLFAFLRSPYSGLTRASVDFVEGRLRGRAIATPERVEEEAQALRGAPLPALDSLRGATSAVEAVRELAGSMLRAAHGLHAPPADEAARQDLRAHETIARLLGELEGWERLAGPLGRDEVVAALERATFWTRTEPGRVPVLSFRDARNRRFDAVFVLGLEEGTLPRRDPGTPFLDDDVRRDLGGRLVRADPVSRDRYLFYVACSRPSRRLYLVREAATDEGSPREPSPFWEEVVALFPPEDVARWTRRRPLSALTWPLEEAPTERERLRALAALASDETGRPEAEAVARANGWERRLDRALAAWSRPTRLRHPLVLEQLRSRLVFNVTELERFADCSSAWFVDRFLDPRSIDAEVDAKLRGSVAHTALHRFFAGLPKELGIERLDESRVEDAVRFMRRCLEGAVEGQRMEMTAMQRRELTESLWRDLEQVVRDEAASGSPLVPHRFEVSFGSERSAPELQRGLELGDGLVLSGKIDRIDRDPAAARAIVQDYKAGKGAHSAREIERELRLQIPLYMLVLRDLVGLEPIGGVYRPLAGDRKPRGLLREAEGLEGYAKSDQLDEDAFWAQVEGAKETARKLAGRIRGGDVRHDPRWGECPSWCDLWPTCRVRRA
jgi:RecB family exonuclease